MRLRSLIPYVLAIPLALCLLAGAGYGQQVVAGHETFMYRDGTPPAGFVGGWKTAVKLRTISDPKMSPVLKDIEEHLRPGESTRKKYPDSPLTWGHEDLHTINANLSNAEGAGVRAFYCMNDRAAAFRSPRISKTIVEQSVPQEIRGMNWGVYMTGMNPDMPTFILDEWTAYLASAELKQDLYGNTRDLHVRNEPGGVKVYQPLTDTAAAIEFAGYATVLLQCIERFEPDYPDKAALAEFIAWNINRTIALTKTDPNPQLVNVFYQRFFRGGPSACPDGQCGVPQWDQSQWRPAPVQPTRPVVQKPVPSRPQQPPAVPSVPPSGGAAGCQCKGHKACACDHSKIAALELRICELEALIKSGKLKGEPGPKGDKVDAGPAGPAGAIGPQGSAAKVVSAPVEIIRPDGTKKQLLWPLDGKHGLRLPLNMK